MRAQHREVLRWLKNIGASDARIEPPRGHGGHRRLCFTFAGVNHETPIAATPSDANSFRNKISDLRHLLGLVKPQREPGERRPSRTRRAPQPETSRHQSTRFHERHDLPPLNTPFAALNALLETPP